MKPMKFGESFIFFGIPTVLLYLATHFCIPALQQATGLPVVVCWFICGGTLVFVPLFVAALVFYRLEGQPWQLAAILTRFRLNKFSWRDLAWSLAGVVVIGALTYGVMEVGKILLPGFTAQPSFMKMRPLTAGEMWILAAWLPLFIFNIWGEGLFWRGYIFPRQELAFGAYTWLAHGAFWLMFHLAFGVTLLITLSPIIFITAYIVQKTKSTWPDIIIHTLINGSGFLLVAFGLVG
jgi:membrane protease YdiL (CAAX protease family)